MIYLEHGMIIQHWLFTSLEGFHGSGAEKENFPVHHFGKILEQNLVGGELEGAIPLPSGRALSALGKRFCPKTKPCPHLHQCFPHLGDHL